MNGSSSRRSAFTTVFGSTRMVALSRLLRGPVTLAVALSSAAAPVEAVVNTEAMRVEAREGTSGFVEADLSLRSGNVDLAQVGVGGRLQWARLWDAGDIAAAGLEDGLRLDRNRVFLVANLSFVERGDDVIDRSAFGHLRWTRHQSPRAAWELFGQLEYDESHGLDRRALAGGGIRLGLVVARTAAVHLGTGYLIERERLADPALGPDETAHRSTNYLAFKWNRTDGLRAGSITYLQPRLDGFGDVRMLSDTQLHVPLAQRLSLGFALLVRYDSRPPPNVDELDVSVRTVFRVPF